MNAPLPVREYASAAEMRAHYRALHAKTFGAVPVVPAQRVSVRIVAVKPYQPAMRFEEKAALDRAALTKAIQQAAQVAAPSRHSIHEIIDAVSDVTGHSKASLTGGGRGTNLPKARQIAFWLARRTGQFSLPQIGRYFGFKHHTSVLHGCRRVDKVISTVGLTIVADSTDMALKLWSAAWPRVSP